MAARCALILVLSLTCGLLAVDSVPVDTKGFQSRSLRQRCLTQFRTVESIPASGQQHTSSYSDECCPDGWSRSDSRCFMFFHGPKSWIDAELACIHVGGNLASVHSLNDNQFLRDLVFRVTGEHANTWVGGHDGVKEGVWLWSDGSKFDFDHWSPGEPNNYGGEHCLGMNWGQHLWNDFPCTHTLPFVCSTRSAPRTE